VHDEYNEKETKEERNHMLFPWLAIASAAVGLVILLTRKTMTYKKEGARIWMLVIIASFGILGGVLDAHYTYTTLLTWGWLAGGIAQVGTGALVLGIGAMVLSWLGTAVHAGKYPS
jgi:hypothetical protein